MPDYIDVTDSVTARLIREAEQQAEADRWSCIVPDSRRAISRAHLAFWAAVEAKRQPTRVRVFQRG